MSVEGYFSPGKPYWLSAYGVDQVYLNYIELPPFANIEKGILYSLEEDHYLRYNGNIVATGGSVMGDGFTFDPQPSNPGDANTLWKSSVDGNLYIGAINLQDDTANGFTLVPQASNPGGPNTLWKSSVDGDLYIGATNLQAGGSGGDVVGPAIATDNAIATYDGTTGKLIQDSDLTIDSNGNISRVGSKYIHIPSNNSQCLGVEAGNSLLVGDLANTAIGYRALRLTSTGSQNNTAVGNQAGTSLAVNCDNNTLIGSSAMVNNTQANNCVAVGVGAGINAADPCGNCIFIGNTGQVTDSANITRIGQGQSECYVAGIRTGSGKEIVYVDANNKLFGGADYYETSLNYNQGSGISAVPIIVYYSIYAYRTSTTITAIDGLVPFSQLTISALLFSCIPITAPAGVTATASLLKNGSVVAGTSITLTSIGTTARLSGSTTFSPVTYAINDTICLQVLYDAAFTNQISQVQLSVNGTKALP